MWNEGPFPSRTPEESMANAAHERRVQLGCGTLIVIALIVMFFSQAGRSNLEDEIRALRSEVGEIKELIETQSAEIHQLREKPATAPPKAAVEKGKAL
jgi:Sec-independent protein translocase protein TatA